MKKIYPQETEIKYARIYIIISAVIVVITSYFIRFINECKYTVAIFVILLWGISITFLMIYILYYFTFLQSGYCIHDGIIETRLWARRWKKRIVLADVKGICICYGFMKSTRYGEIKIKKNIIINGKKVRIDCPWISLLSEDLKCMIPNMSNKDIYRCTGSEEIYGFAAFNMESVAELIKNFQGIYYIPVDIYEKYKPILEKMIVQYQIPSDRIKILAVR